MYWPFTFFSYLGLTPNHTGHESVHSLGPANGLWWRQASKAAVLILLLISCQSIAKLVLLLRFVLCWAAVFLVFLFIVTPLISGQLWYIKRETFSSWKQMWGEGWKREENGGRGSGQLIQWAAGGVRSQRQREQNNHLKADLEPELQWTMSQSWMLFSVETVRLLIYLLSVDFLQHHSASDLLVCHKGICSNSKIIRC